ncbi:hypothetical protein FWG86_00655 [Candidatus Saccharibacteria bacterium]|nr:hypothetical protein [Candidatus Saccharibacteria bacterium]
MEIDFDALDQVISEKRASSKSTSAAALKTPKYIDVIQAGAVKRPAPVRARSTRRKVKKIITKKVEKAPEPPTVSIAELVDRELDKGDGQLGEDLPQELNVDDLVAYAEGEAIIEDPAASPQEAAEDFLSEKPELAPFLPGVKVEKTPLSDDVPEHVAVRASKSERELAGMLIEDDLVADKAELKEQKKEKEKEKEREREEAKQEKEREKEKEREQKKERGEQKEQARILTEKRRPASRKKASTGLLVLLGILIATFGAVAGAFIYLLTND